MTANRLESVWITKGTKTPSAATAFALFVLRDFAGLRGFVIQTLASVTAFAPGL